jgi:hypothetical protein
MHRRKIGDCLGVDLNRNFNGYNSWQPSTCPSNIYGGPAPFSEPETKAIAGFLRTLRSRHRVVAAIDFHSFAYAQPACAASLCRLQCSAPETRESKNLASIAIAHAFVVRGHAGLRDI